MNVVIFGASGMIGQGVMRECIIDAGVERIVSVGRSAVGLKESKVLEVVQPNLLDLSSCENALRGIDACFWCLGVTSAGMNEADYTRITHDITLHAAQTLLRLNPTMSFVFISGAGADSTEQGKVMWARIKGKTENALLQMPFSSTYVFRPAAIRAMNGEISRTRAYRIMYPFLSPIMWLLSGLLPNVVTTTEKIGRGMLHAVRQGAPKKVLECADINALTP